MRIKIGCRLNHETLIEAIMDGKEKGKAVIEYAEEVMKRKKETEKMSEGIKLDKQGKGKELKPKRN